MLVSTMREHATQILEAKDHELHFSVDEKVLRFSLGMERHWWQNGGPIV